MKRYMILVLCLSYQCDVTTGAILDHVCNTFTYISPGDVTTYYISNSQQYASLCKVRFESTTALTISGSSLDCRTCHVSVWDGYDIESNSDGDICRQGYFQKTYTSDFTGINLHVQGTACGTAGLMFEVRQGCAAYQFTCDNGHCVENSDRCDNFYDCSDRSDEQGCFWSVGAYVGISIGSFVVVCIAAGLAAMYRRRVILSRPTLVVPASQAVVTQSRW